MTSSKYNPDTPVRRHLQYILERTRLGEFTAGMLCDVTEDTFSRPSYSSVLRQLEKEGLVALERTEGREKYYRCTQKMPRRQVEPYFRTPKAAPPLPDDLTLGDLVAICTTILENNLKDMCLLETTLNNLKELEGSRLVGLKAKGGNHEPTTV